jgi:hypothetical protein
LETDKITFNTFKFKDNENRKRLVDDGIVKQTTTNLGFDLTVKA